MVPTERIVPRGRRALFVLGGVVYALIGIAVIAEGAGLGDVAMGVACVGAGGMLVAMGTRLGVQPDGDGAIVYCNNGFRRTRLHGPAEVSRDVVSYRGCLDFGTVRVVTDSASYHLEDCVSVCLVMPGADAVVDRRVATIDRWLNGSDTGQ